MPIKEGDSWKIIHKDAEKAMLSPHQVVTLYPADRQNVHNKPSTEEWKSKLQDQYPKTCKNKDNEYLPGVSDERLTLDNFHLHFDKGLEHASFPAPLITRAEEQHVDKFLESYVKKGILERAPESARLVLHPTILIPKRNKEQLRLVVDFRPTNKMFSPFPFDMADRTSILQSIPAGMKFFSVLDIADAFYQIRITDSRLKNFFGIHVRNDYYRFARLPMGWKNSPAICQLVYSTILGRELSHCCRLYMDDILIFSEDLTGHLKALHRVLSRLQTNSIQINWDKASIAQKEVEYLGILISEKGLRPSAQLIDKLNCLAEANLSNRNAWQKARGILIQYQRYGPRVAQLIEAFRVADQQTRKQIIAYLAQLQFSLHIECLQNYVGKLIGVAHKAH